MRTSCGLGLELAGTRAKMKLNKIIFITLIYRVEDVSLIIVISTILVSNVYIQTDHSFQWGTVT